ncbi:MAG: hypothetical protein NTV79_05190, partial [Candidatus Aureabacteria bacterium]|nr:hypothetical protein [Candidatus Auribacterota bacterium]
GPTPPPSPAETAADPFQAALLHLIAQAAREGKRVTVNRTRVLSGEIPLQPFVTSQPASTSVTAVEIKEGEDASDPSLESLLRAQEAVLAALAIVCRGQENLGGKISRVSSQNEGLSRDMQDLGAGVGEVREGVSGNSSLTGTVADLEAGNAGLLAALASQVKALNQTVEGLVSSMGAVGAEVSSLLAGVEERVGEADGQKGGKGGAERSAAGGEESADVAADSAPSSPEGASSQEAPSGNSNSGGEE